MILSFMREKFYFIACSLLEIIGKSVSNWRMDLVIPYGMSCLLRIDLNCR